MLKKQDYIQGAIKFVPKKIFNIRAKDLLWLYIVLLSFPLLIFIGGAEEEHLSIHYSFLFKATIGVIFIIALIVYIIEVGLEKRFIYINNKGVKLITMKFIPFISIVNESQSFLILWENINTVKVEKKHLGSSIDNSENYNIYISATKNNHIIQSILWDIEDSQNIKFTELKINIPKNNYKRDRVLTALTGLIKYYCPDVNIDEK